MGLARKFPTKTPSILLLRVLLNWEKNGIIRGKRGICVSNHNVTMNDGITKFIWHYNFYFGPWEWGMEFLRKAIKEKEWCPWEEGWNWNVPAGAMWYNIFACKWNGQAPRQMPMNCKKEEKWTNIWAEEGQFFGVVRHGTQLFGLWKCWLLRCEEVGFLCMGKISLGNKGRRQLKTACYWILAFLISNFY